MHPAYVLYSFLALAVIVAHGQLKQSADNASCWHTLGDWIQLKDIPMMHVEASSTVFNKKLYVFSGFTSPTWGWTDNLDILDPQTNTWETKKMPFFCSHTPLENDGKYIYGAGGLVPWNGQAEFTTKVWRFNPLDDTWIDLADLPDMRWSGALVFDTEKNLHYVAGLRERYIEQSNHWRLSEIEDDSGEWEILPAFPMARSHFQSKLIDGVMYAIGGTFGNYDDSAIVHGYDIATEQWVRKQDMPEVRSHAESGTLKIDDRILVLGGRGGPGVPTTIVEYDPVRDEWHTHSVKLPEPLETPNCGYIEDVEIQGQTGNFILVSGGGEMKDYAAEWASPSTYAIKINWECGPIEESSETSSTSETKEEETTNKGLPTYESLDTRSDTTDVTAILATSDRDDSLNPALSAGSKVSWTLALWVTSLAAMNLSVHP